MFGSGQSSVIPGSRQHLLLNSCLHGALTAWDLTPAWECVSVFVCVWQKERARERATGPQPWVSSYFNFGLRSGGDPAIDNVLDSWLIRRDALINISDILDSVLFLCWLLTWYKAFAWVNASHVISCCTTVKCQHVLHGQQTESQVPLLWSDSYFSLPLLTWFFRSILINEPPRTSKGKKHSTKNSWSL